MDALLVTPPSRTQVYQGLASDLAAIEVPVWSGLMANYLRRKGYSVQILDGEALNLTPAQMAAEIAAIKPKLAVFVVYGQQPSASTQCMPGGRAVCRALKESAPEIPTIVMGTHASALPERTVLEEPYDFVCQGEGPQTVEALLQTLPGGDFSKVPGLWYRDDFGKAARGPLSVNIRDLDNELPGVAWDLLDMKGYRAHNWHCFDHLSERTPYASLQTSLGCPYHCSFCCINAPFGKAGIRFWSPEFVIGQIDLLVREYGVTNIKIPDEMFVMNERHVMEICDKIIERGYKLNFWAYARIDTVKEKFIEKLKRAGFNWLVLGIESGSKYVRDGVEKGRFNNVQVTEVVHKIRSAGIYVMGNYIFGLPDDNFESMQETLDLAKSMNTEWANFYCAMAYPGSKLHAHAIENKLPLPKDWIGYAQHSFECQPLPTETLSGAQVLGFRDRAFTEYFRSEKYLGLVEAKFGSHVREHVWEMSARSVPRQLLAEPSNLTV